MCRVRGVKTHGWLLAIGIVGLVIVGLAQLPSGVQADPLASVTGTVVDAEGPVTGARVRVRATDNLTLTATDGRFTLAGLAEGEEIEVTAWADGYYVASSRVTPTVSGITLTLRAYHTTDHPEYAWSSPISGTSEVACGNCHPVIMPQWITNAHGSAISNPRFFSLYNGTDVTGTLLVGTGYLKDFPNTAGNCANCHAPAAGVDGYLTTDMNTVRGVITAGVHCDYCHKVAGSYLNPATQSVYANAPGAQSQRVLRPPAGDNIFFGPYDDVHDPDTYLPAISESQFCAPCHQFSMWGTPIYESYEEWLGSPYATAGVTCQDCHMPPTGDAYFALPAVGGLAHPPERIPSHLQVGARDVELLRNTVAMTAHVRQVADRIQTSVIITNAEAGHHVPTDFPGRHLILTVQAAGEAAEQLVRRAGPVVPEWGGAEAGLPGKAYAKVLRDVRTGASPVVSYWRQALIASDNRIPALGSDTSVYTFSAPVGGGAVTVTAELRFRRAFQDVMDTKGWDTLDIVMAQVQVTLMAQAWVELYLPLAARSL